MTLQTLRKQETSAPFSGAGKLVSASGAKAVLGGFAIMHGTLAPEGCFVCLAGFDAPAFDRKARVFSHAEAAQDAILDGDICDQDIIVLCGASSQALSAIRHDLELMGLGDVNIITDARITGAASAHLIGNVAPSAAAGGPIGKVRNGDRIHINIAGRHIDLMTDFAASAADVRAPRAFAPAERYARMFAAR
ncbi:MAG: dihydroxy-acid dehydratase [Asticcacaulis sp.]